MRYHSEAYGEYSRTLRFACGVSKETDADRPPTLARTTFHRLRYGGSLHRILISTLRRVEWGPRDGLGGGPGRRFDSIPRDFPSSEAATAKSPATRRPKEETPKKK